MDFDDLVVPKAPPQSRASKANAEHEHHLYEGAVMLAFAMHLLRTEPTSEVCIHPDGEHGKQFDFTGWLERRGFSLQERMGKTSYGGRYRDKEGRVIVINPKSGQGDVKAKVGGEMLSAECKGGIINTKHCGQVSRLRRGLCEAVGLLMDTPPAQGRQVAVVPYTEVTCRLANCMALRCASVGIEIALVKSRGEVIYVKSR